MTTSEYEFAQMHSAGAMKFEALFTACVIPGVMTAGVTML